MGDADEVKTGATPKEFLVGQHVEPGMEHAHRCTHCLVMVGDQCCSRCKALWVCSKACLKSAWPEHKKVCKHASELERQTHRVSMLVFRTVDMFTNTCEKERIQYSPEATRHCLRSAVVEACRGEDDEFKATALDIVAGIEPLVVLRLGSMGASPEDATKAHREGVVQMLLARVVGRIGCLFSDVPVWQAVEPKVRAIAEAVIRPGLAGVDTMAMFRKSPNPPLSKRLVEQANGSMWDKGMDKVFGVVMSREEFVAFPSWNMDERPRSDFEKVQAALVHFPGLDA